MKLQVLVTGVDILRPEDKFQGVAVHAFARGEWRCAQWKRGDESELCACDTAQAIHRDSG